ncbi:hypothetical protein ILUMI_20969 [Ignelater luminosus]|uniref:Uncharacterized protein n=1 Tax=Ignelater luminosus TaxID=2038154 RepID=A0A8K0CIQ3_IGNLU|nr:hypothetical protein ILUMI_20969 [Ignelater luminosus]
MSARAKAKEKVVINTINCQRQELKERQVRLDEEIVYLTEMKERLQHQLEHGQLNRKQLEQEMCNTGKIVQMLTENYHTIKERHGYTFQSIQNVENVQNVQFDSYKSKKSELLNCIERENKELIEIQNNWEKEISEYNAQLDKIINTSNELTKKEADLAKEIAQKTEINKKLESKFQEDTKVLSKLHNEEQVLLDEIRSTESKIEELEKQHREKSVEYKEILQTKETELTQTIERQKNAEERKMIVTKELEDEVKLTNKLEANYSELEEQRLSLLAKKEELENHAKVVNEDRKARINSLECEIQKLDNDMVIIDTEITSITKTKTEKLEELNLKKQLHEEGMAKLNQLENECEKLRNEINVNQREHIENENNLISLQNRLPHLQELLSTEEKRHHFLEKELDEQLQKLNEELRQQQTKLANTQGETGNSIKDLETELTAYKDKTERLIKENKEKNSQLLEKLRADLRKIRNEVNEEENNMKELKLLCEHKKAERSRLEIALALTKIDTEEPALIKEPANAKPTGILKSPGKRTPPKSVSWKVPSTSTIDSEPLADVSPTQELDITPFFSNMPDNSKSKDELFDELRMWSRPDEEMKVIPKKRSRID